MERRKDMGMKTRTRKRMRIRTRKKLRLIMILRLRPGPRWSLRLSWFLNLYLFPWSMLGMAATYE
jgi:hypothetical protein